VRVQRLRQPEVEDFDGPVMADPDVRRLEVPVDDVRFVRRVRRVGNLPRHPQGVHQRDRSAADHHREVVPVDQLHDERAGVRLPRAGLQPIDLRNVGMVERGERLLDPANVSYRLTVRVLNYPKVY
jgi:hypothetical protein